MPSSRLSRRTSSTSRLLWSAMATSWATWRATWKQQSSSPSLRRVGDLEDAERLPLEDQREGDQRAVAERGEPRLVGEARPDGVASDRPPPARRSRWPGRRRCRRARRSGRTSAGGVARIGDQRGEGLAGRLAVEPVDDHPGLPEAPVEELAGPVEHHLELDRGEDGLDGLLDDLLVDVVGDDGQRHGPLRRHLKVTPPAFRCTANAPAGGRRASRSEQSSRRRGRLGVGPARALRGRRCSARR